MDTYMFAPYLEEVLAGPVDDYVAVTHGGHGINSMSLNYLLVSSPIVVMSQVAWGGAYMDEGEQRLEWAAEMKLVAALTKAAAGLTDGDLRGRLVVVHSPFRKIAAWGIMRDREPMEMGRLTTASEGGPLIDALNRLRDRPDPERGRATAVKLRWLGVKGILVTAAEQGYITQLACKMPVCYCPEELGGATYFEKLGTKPTDWMPTHEHFPRPKWKGGHREVDNAVLAHRLCNRIDYSKSIGRSYARDLARVKASREAAIQQS